MHFWRGAAPVSRLIVVVEDDPYIRADLCELLEYEGYCAQGYSNGREALESLEKSESLPSLIVLDLMMPVMNGYEFLAERARYPRLAGIPVVVQSAESQAVRNLGSAPIRAFVRKPLDIEVFLATVAKHALV